MQGDQGAAPPWSSSIRPDPATGLERIEAALGGVEQALVRLDHGSYGTCEHCRQRLAEEVLNGDPLARRCVDHR